MLRPLVLSFLVACTAFGQFADFDIQGGPCAYAFPACGAGGDPEGVSFNGAFAAFPPPLFGATIGAANGLGMPLNGPQFLRVQCANPGMVVGSPAGGPIPPAMACAQALIPVPPGAIGVSFAWDFYNAEGPFAVPYNDAIQIDFAGGCAGPPLAIVVYADTTTGVIVSPPDGTPCGAVPYGPAGPLTQAAPLGRQFVLLAPVPPGAVFLRVSAANGSDNSFPGQCVVDAVRFTLPCELAFMSPLGPGSIFMTNTPCPPAGGAFYLTAITLAPGLFPGGWFFGLDITITDLTSQFLTGFPFAGPLSPLGDSAAGPFGGLPSSLNVFAVTVQWTPGFGFFMGARPPTAYAIP